MMELSLFEGFTSKLVLTTTLEEVVEMIRSDKRLMVTTDTYRRTEDRSIKMQSPLIAVACRFQGGKGREHITRLTGLSMADIDHISPKEIQTAKPKIQNDPHTLLCYTTISGRGLRILFRYDLDESLPLEQQVKLYPMAFRTGNDYYEQLLGLQTDRQCKNVTRLSGLASDAEVYYNPDAKVMEVKNEKPKMKKEFNTAEACRRVRAMVERREQFVEGNHHNYLTKLLFLLSDYGVPETEAVAYLASEFPEYHNEDFTKLAWSCYSSVAYSFGSKHLGRGRRTDDSGKTKMERVAEFLAQQPLRYDVLSRKVQILSSEEDGKMSNAKWTELSDRRANSLLHDCNRALGLDVSKTTFMPMLLSSRIPEVNPLREYIRSLPQWDGQTDYIGQVAAMVHVRDTNPNGQLNMDDGQLFLSEEQSNPQSTISNPQSSILNPQFETPSCLWQRCFRKWFVAMVAGWMKDEVVNHQVLVLIGEQGIYKTTWLDALMPPELVQYKCRQSGTRYLDKDEQLRATEFGLINMDEIDRMTEAELNALKSLITATEVNVRAPYAYGKERRLRVASYVASGNKERFLTDQTGNRRWLPFHVVNIESPFTHPLPYQGLYAQAWQLVQEGFDYWFSLDEIRQFASHVEEFAVETNEQQLMPVYFEPCPAGTPGAQLLTVAEISAKLTYYGNIRHPMDIRQLGALLRKMGYETKRFGKDGRRGYIVMELSADAVNAKRKIMA